ncbi:flagellar export protein FliJ [Marinibactrum halimedae]|uniref:Flagellar FliJ protein n=1 Tax=Marinibactrum halimedae TaxID=1444977 RepID=A0AA37TDF0_9GAMM|nr:flagellar export protein FliJ [Marinibactrum halimedae]MCD9458848.1 flagellar export protein FliJ [Marinibactrum halimedae]GLS27700.1 flagellar FliJ protein [Marinibactrum halimedae]
MADNDRTRRLAVVLQLAQKAENDAAKLLQQQRAQWMSDVNQLKQLHHYFEEYVAQFSSVRGSVSTETLISQRHFVGQLENVIETQSERVETLRQQTDRAERFWREKHQRRKLMEELIERIRLDGDHIAEKQLQKELDEMAGQSFIRGQKINS